MSDTIQKKLDLGNKFYMLFNLLKSIDFYSIKPNFKIMRMENFKTTFGSVLSIITIILTLISLIYYYIIFVDDKNPRLLFSLNILANPPLTTLNAKNYGFGFSLQNPFTYDQFIDETIYYPLVFKMTGTRVIKGNTTLFEWNVLPVELDYCNINKFPNQYHKLIKDLPFKDYYCMKDPSFDLSGTFLNSQYKYLIIKLFECKNSTDIDMQNKNRIVNTNNIKRFLRQEENGNDYFDFTENDNGYANKNEVEKLSNLDYKKN
jgi:hypothetical protein